MSEYEQIYEICNKIVDRTVQRTHITTLMCKNSAKELEEQEKVIKLASVVNERKNGLIEHFKSLSKVNDEILSEKKLINDNTHNAEHTKNELKQNKKLAERKLKIYKTLTQIRFNRHLSAIVIADKKSIFGFKMIELKVGEKLSSTLFSSQLSVNGLYQDVVDLKE